jgi:hypothetical protein
MTVLIKALVAFIYLLFLPFFLLAQTKFTVSGTIRDAFSLETLNGASVKVSNEEGLIIRSNEYGFYSILLESGEYRMQISYVGYRDTIVNIGVSKNTLLTIELQPGNTLQEVQINAGSRESQLKNTLMGINELNVKDVENIPVIFGEKDLLKTLQLLPGVSSSGEGNSGFVVRGGSSDQNLIILDEATVYNSSHLFGFFSTFNSDAIKDVRLYKGGMPAQYGGRLSSVVDVNMLDGNKKSYHVKGGIGLIASRLSLEGPIIKEKGSFMVSARRTYADLFLKLSKDSTVNRSALYFYDLNLKSNYQINEKNTIYLSGYFGKDVLGYADAFNFNWGNITSTLRWNHIYNPRLFSNLSLIYSDYNYNVEVFDKTSNFSIKSLIKNYQFKQDFQLFENERNSFRFGINGLYQKIAPASLDATAESQINSVPIESRHGADISLYGSHQWKASEKLNFEYGLRINNFLSLGPGTFQDYDENGNVISSELLGSNEIAKWYLNFEPRLSVNFMMNDRNSIKFSFNRNIQNLHQLSNTTSTLPTDIWIMSSRNIKPQSAIQGALGYYRNLDDDHYEFSTEVYYKDMRSQIDYKNGAEIQANPNLEADLLYGVGRAYGLELFLKKREGDFNGWISYTLSRSERQFDQINNGKWYPAKQDATHNLNLVAMYEINPRLSFSASFVLTSGNAVTFPSGKYTIDNGSIWYYSQRNGYRMPLYHRLDMGLTLKSKMGSRFNSSWNFGLYNAYNHKNAFLIDFRENKDNPKQSEAYQISLFGIVPSVTWNFNF